MGDQATADVRTTSFTAAVDKLREPIQRWTYAMGIRPVGLVDAIFDNQSTEPQHLSHTEVLGQGNSSLIHRIGEIIRDAAESLVPNELVPEDLLSEPPEAGEFRLAVIMQIYLDEFIGSLNPARLKEFHDAYTRGKRVTLDSRVLGEIFENLKIMCPSAWRASLTATSVRYPHLPEDFPGQVVIDHIRRSPNPGPIDHVLSL